MLDGPVTPTGIEKFILSDGSYKLIYRPRITNFMENKKVGGSLADEDGFITHRTTLVHLSTVVERISMGWDHSRVRLVEMEHLPLTGNAG